MTDDTKRYADELFPGDYASWRYCIEVKCGQALTNEFLQSRIAILSDAKHEESRGFVRLYGEAYLEQVLSWFERAAAEA